MKAAAHRIWIARTPEQVFDFFTDFTQAPRWRQFVQSMALEGSGPLRGGSRVKVVMNVLGGDYAFDLDVLAVERPSLWRHRTNEVHFRGFVEYTFTPSNGGTLVTMTIEAKPVGLYGWLSLPIMLLQRPKPYAQQLPQLKRAMEER